MGSGAAEIEGRVLPGAALTRTEVTARRWQLVVTAIVVVAIDQATKAWAVEALADSSIDGPLGSSLRLVYNTGSAFSLGRGFGPFFGVIAIVVAISLVWMVRSVHDRTVVLGLGFIQGGAIGNVVDRVFRDGDGLLGGSVIDFLEMGTWWPVFNFADVAIVVGGALVVLFGARG